ncbi:MAG: hypothetical protein V4598_04170 [Bdellovibrionota bacterium]
MKTLVAIVLLISATAHAVVPEVAAKLSGAYVADGSCAFETATVKVERSEGMDFFVIRARNENTSNFKSQSVNLDNLWTKVRTTRGFQRIITQDVIRGNAVVAEEKTCLPGWVGCSDWNTAAEIKLVDEMTMEATLGEETCTFKKVQL